MRTVAAIGAVVAVALGGCGQQSADMRPLADRVGQECSVQFRRGDALGGGGGLPVSPTTDSINGASVGVTGKLLAVTDEWVTVESGTNQYCISRESILLVRFQK